MQGVGVQKHRAPDFPLRKTKKRYLAQFPIEYKIFPQKPKNLHFEHIFHVEEGEVDCPEKA